MEDHDIPFTMALKSRINKEMPDAETLIYLFVITFARFEFALKNTSRFLKSSIPKGISGYNFPIAEPDWKEFAKSISNGKGLPSNDPALIEAINYINEYPPSVQIVVHGKLEWGQSRSNGNPLYEAIYFLQTIRNNLLHGSKFEGSYARGTRNYQLITSGLILINYLVTLDEEIKDKFQDWLV